jgi:hypothetical protein
VSTTGSSPTKGTGKLHGMDAGRTLRSVSTPPTPSVSAQQQGAYGHPFVVKSHRVKEIIDLPKSLFS